VIVFYLKRAIEKRKVQKIQEQLKESKHVTEKEKIRVYLDEINEETRNKQK
jgi:F0F1-type ATP synthase delta subunit